MNVFSENSISMHTNIIHISSDVQSGAPVFSGTRVPIKNLFDYLKGGDSIHDFLQDFPSVKEKQVIRLLSWLENISTYNTHEENIA